MKTLFLYVTLTALLLAAGLYVGAQAPDNLKKDPPATAKVEDMGNGLKKVVTPEGTTIYFRQSQSQSQTQAPTRTSRTSSRRWSGRSASGQLISLNVNQSVSQPAQQTETTSTAADPPQKEVPMGTMQIWQIVLGCLAVAALVYAAIMFNVMVVGRRVGVQLVNAFRMVMNSTNSDARQVRMAMSGTAEGDFCFSSSPANPTPVIPVVVMTPPPAGPPAGYIPGPVVTVAPITLVPGAPLPAPVTPPVTPPPVVPPPVAPPVVPPVIPPVVPPPVIPPAGTPPIVPPVIP